MIHFTRFVVISEKQRVGQLCRIFPCTLLEKLCVGSKKFNDLDELYHHAKFGEDRTTRLGVGAKIWCLYIVFFLSCSEAGAPFVRCVHSSHMYCVTVNGSILMRFLTIFFSELTTLSDALHISHFCR